MIFLFIAIALNLIRSTYTMKRKSKAPLESTEIQTPRSTKLKTIWIKTPEQELISIPEWQIDQMKALQLFLAHQKGNNSKNNPIDLSVVIKDNGTRVQTNAQTFNFLKTALENANDIKAFSIFYFSLSKDEQANLIRGAFELEANALTALLGQTIFPLDIQNQINLRLLASIKTYFINKLKIEFSSAQNLNTINRDVVEFNYEVKISPDGQYILSNHINDLVLLWYIPQKKLMSSFKGDIHDFNFSPKGGYLIQSTPTGYDYYKKNHVHHDFKNIASMNNTVCTALSPDDEDLCLIQSGANPHNLRLFSLTNPSVVIKELIGHDGEINTINFSPDGNYIISGSEGNNNLILWDGKTFNIIKVLDKHRNNIINANFTPDNQFIISEDENDNMFVWDVKTHNYICQWNHSLLYNPSYANNYISHKHTGYISWITYSADIKLAIIENAPKNEYSLNSILSNDESFRLMNNNEKLVVYNIKEKNNKNPHPYKIPFPIDTAVQSSNSTYIAFANTENYNNAFLIKPFKDMTFYTTLEARPLHTIHFSPHNDYIIVTHSKENVEDPDDLLIFTLWNIADIEKINTIFKSNITLSQAQFLYRLYLAQLNKVKVIIDKNDQDYATYQSLPKDIKELVDKFLPFGIASELIKQTFKEFHQ